MRALDGRPELGIYDVAESGSEQRSADNQGTAKNAECRLCLRHIQPRECSAKSQRYEPQPWKSASPQRVSDKKAREGQSRDDARWWPLQFIPECRREHDSTQKELDSGCVMRAPAHAGIVLAAVLDIVSARCPHAALCDGGLDLLRRDA